ncbi:MAG: UDP-glucose 4-epimerase GalE [Bacillota bacterium]
MNVLVTGGAGYIGSHTCVELLKNGENVIIVDNFSNSKPEVLKRIKDISKKDFKFYEIDLCNKSKLNKVFKENKIDAVIHFAGLKAVGESVEKPIKYYKNNLVSSINLVEVMENHNVKKIVFSSSATVYGKPEKLPLKEEFKTSTTNPYGSTKLMIERIYTDLYNSENSWAISLLRYFNPIGAHESGMIGEDPTDIPNNLMPYITQVAVGKRDKLSIFGNDYDTHDGTGVRDYIHVVDLAKGHLKALRFLDNNKGVHIHNLGTGQGYSVLDVVKNFEKATGVKIDYEITKRRPGDIAACYADVKKAKEELGWEAQKGIYEMCKDSWRWQQKNPEGYVSKE